jgi:HupE / UreJ protein
MRIGLLTLAAVAVAGRVAAHDRTTSYSAWEIRDRDARVSVRLAELDVSRFTWAADPDAGQRLATYLTGHLRLATDGGPCPVTDGPRALDRTPGRRIYEWTVTCDDTAGLRIESDVLLDVAPSHLHFARVTRDGASGPEHVLSAGERVWQLEGGGSAPSSIARYVLLGIEHIATGYDHLAFLAALLLIAGSLGEVARIVTGFTAAHSLTLALAALGWVRPDRAPIEALIGLSIALVAAENVWLAGGRGRVLPAMVTGGLALLAIAGAAGVGRVPALTLAGLGLFAACYFPLLGRVARPATLRWGLAFLFGLVHGFGFAAVLTEAGLEPGRLARALVGFNAGVETGQLAIVAAIWPLLLAVARRRTALVEVGSAAVAGLGLFWFVTRAYG